MLFDICIQHNDDDTCIDDVACTHPPKCTYRSCYNTHTFEVCVSVYNTMHMYIFPPHSFDLCIFTVLTDTHFIMMSQGAWKGIILFGDQHKHTPFQSIMVVNLTVLTPFLLVECCVYRYNTLLLLLHEDDEW